MLSDKRSIVLHHSLTKDGETVSWNAIRRYHVDTNGWRAIGYHYGIENIGGRFEILSGRFVEEDAAAVKEKGLNKTGIHICLVGNFDLVKPPVPQWNLTVGLVRSLMAVHGIKITNIYGHRDFSPYKTCPGAKFDLEQFRFDVQRGSTKVA